MFCIVLRGDLTVVMETHCKSTKEVTDDIDMTNIFFSDFCPRSLPLPFSFIHVAHVFEKLPVDIVLLPSSPSLTVAFILSHPVHALLLLSKCVWVWVCLCVCVMKNVNSKSHVTV